MIFMLLLLLKNKSEIWFQYLNIIHTCNTHDNINIAISTSDILFNVKEIQFLLEIFEKKDP